MHKRLPLFALLLSVWWIAHAVAAQPKAATERPPNILWICTDQHRWDTISALGNPHVETPHLDRLVREGASW